MAKIENFEWSQGNDGILNCDVDPASLVDALTSLSGCIVKFQVFEIVKGVPQTGTPIISKVSPASIDITDAPNMLYEVHMDRADTLNLYAPKEYYHEHQVQDALGKIVTTTTGILSLKITAIR